MRFGEYEDEFHSSQTKVAALENTSEVEVIGTVKRPGTGANQEMAKKGVGLETDNNKTCNWIFESDIIRADKDPRLFHCSLCDQTFRRRVNLQKHQSSHMKQSMTGDRVKSASKSLDNGVDMPKGEDEPHDLGEIDDVEPEVGLESVERGERLETLAKETTSAGSSQFHSSPIHQAADIEAVADEALVDLVEEENDESENCSDPLALDNEEDQTRDSLSQTASYSSMESTNARCRACDFETCMCGFAIDMAKKARVVLDPSAVRDWQRSNNTPEDGDVMISQPGEKDDKQVKGAEPEPRRKRKLIKRLSKPSVAKDPTEKLIEDLMDHLGIAGDKTFNGMLKTEKDVAGTRLQNLLDEVSGGAIVPLLKRDYVKKLANLKGFWDHELSSNSCPLGCVKKEEEEDDVDARMSAAVADMEGTMQGENKDGGIISDDDVDMMGDSSSSTQQVLSSNTQVFPSTPLLCSVCSDSVLIRSTASPACHTCVNFFRIFTKESRGQCRNGGNCVITKETRAKCVACRYDKCVSVGIIAAPTDTAMQQVVTADKIPLGDVDIGTFNDGARIPIARSTPNNTKCKWVFESGKVCDERFTESDFLDVHMRWHKEEEMDDVEPVKSKEDGRKENDHDNAILKRTYGEAENTAEPMHLSVGNSSMDVSEEVATEKQATKEDFDGRIDCKDNFTKGKEGDSAIISDDEYW